MSTTNDTFPAAPTHGIPDGLLQATVAGDTTAMRALADFLRERGLPSREIDGEQTPSDDELATGYLQLAHECEQSVLRLRQLDELLSFIAPPARLSPSRRRAGAAPRTRVKLIKRFLRRAGIHLFVVAGDRSRRLPVVSQSHLTYTIYIPWTGQDQSALHGRLLHHLAAAFPADRFITATLPVFWYAGVSEAASWIRATVERIGAGGAT